jgi:hypothetical protein
MSERETFQTGMRLTGRRPSVRCRACDATVAHTTRGLCSECREDSAAWAYIDGRRVRVTTDMIDAHLDALDVACAAGLHPSQGRRLDAHGETCGSCGRRVVA